MAIFVAGDGIVCVCLFVCFSIFCKICIIYMQCMNVQFISVPVLFIVLTKEIPWC